MTGKYYSQFRFRGICWISEKRKSIKFQGNTKTATAINVGGLGLLMESFMYTIDVYDFSNWLKYQYKYLHLQQFENQTSRHR